MKRLNLIIGKKQIVIASLAVVLGAAATANLVLSSKPDTTEKQGNASEVSASANYGDTAYVSNLSTDGDAYFAKARLEKQQSRDETAEVLAGMYQGGDMTKDELSVVTQNAQNLSRTIESENKIETLIKAQGFADAICFLSDNGANVIVKTDGLDAVGAAKIKATLQAEVPVASDNITIVEVK